MGKAIVLLAALGVATLASTAAADDYYVSAARGKGKKGSKEEPVRDLGIIVPKLKAGDTVHIAVGTYVGMSESGADEIKVPVKILGGYSDDFSARDPWGEHKTVLSGINLAKNFSSKPRLHIGDRRTPGEIVVDGIVVDNGARNGYMDETNAEIRRRFQPKTGSNAAPDTPGISLDGAEGARVTVENCAVFNCAPTHKTGAIKVFCGKNGQASIRNNMAVNNTGAGICCLSSWHPKDGKGLPTFTVEHNTVLFTWKFDALSTDSGSGLKLESGVIATVRNNVFAFGDAFGIDNAAKSKIPALENNLFCANKQCVYREFSSDIKLAGIGEEAQCVETCEANVESKITVPAPDAWAQAYAARIVVDRQAAEADIGAKAGWQNDVRSMLGLPLQGGELKLDIAVWLHKIDTDAALKCGQTAYEGKYGSSDPAVTVAAPGK